MDSAHWGLPDSGPLTRCPLWQVDLKLTHLDWSPEATLIHFQGHYLTLCELDYHILHREIQRVAKTRAVAAAAADIGELCLVEDVTSGCWYRGRVQNRKQDLLDVFLIDHGNVLSVGSAHVASCPDDLLELPPKLVCGFLANVLLLRSCLHSVMEQYFLDLVGKNVLGYVQGLLPHKVLLVEVPDINRDLVQHGFGRHVDVDTFLLVVEMLTGTSLKLNVQPVPDLVTVKLKEPEFSSDPASWKRFKHLLSLGGPKLSCGTRARVRVTAAVKAGLFYCQMVSKEQELQEMSKKLAEIFQRKNNEDGSNQAETLGLLCAVKGKEGKWRRGFLPFLPVNSEVRVIFVDYGFFETVKVENVRWLPPDLCLAPIMALPCSLIRPPGQEQLGLLQAGLLGDVLDMEVDSFDEGQCLYSVTLKEVKGDGIEELEHIPKPPAAKVASVPQSEKVSRPLSCLSQEDAMSKALGRTVAAEGLSVDSVFVGFVQHAQSPNSFWVRSMKRNQEFEALTSAMRDHFREVKLDQDVLPEPELGTLCCAMYEEDMHFYRAVVTDVLLHGVEVFFIDFGNSGKVPYMLIKKIPAAFADEPEFAVYCTLAGVSTSDGIWTSSTCDFFRNATLYKSMEIRVVNVGKYKVGVELTELDGEDGRNVADLLVGSRGDECFSTKAKVQHVTTEPTKRRAEAQVEQWEGGVSEESSAAATVQGSPSFKASGIKPGCELTVRCSVLNSPSDFWCQTLGQAPALDQLMEKVQKFYSTHTIPLRAGASCCVAKLPQDGQWYRAAVPERRDRIATALLVDYGSTVQVEERHLQGIIPEFLRVEQQAFRCSLYNPVEPAEDPTNCSLFRDFVSSSGADLKCRVISQVSVENEGRFNVVDLFNGQNQQSAADALAGRASPQQPSPTTIPETFVYSSFDLSPGCEELVYVTHVSSQWELYCQLDKNTEIIERLQEDISVHSKEMLRDGDGDRDRGAVTKLCLAKYSDGNWYRAVVRPAPTPAHLNVFYVDYGNTNLSEKSAVLYVPLDCAALLYTPMQALRCCLHSVPKAELHPDPMECLRSAVLNKLVRARIHGKNEDGSLDVQLFDGDVSINDKVKETLQGLSRPTETTACSAETQGQDRSSVKRQRSAGWSSMSKGKASKKIYVPNSNWKKETVKKPSGGASCVRTTTKPQRNSSAKHPSHKVPDSEAPQQEPEPTPTVRPPGRNLSAGFRAKAFVSHVDSVADFHLQLAEDEAAILKLGEELNCSSFRLSLKNAASVSVGDLVLAVYEDDGALYRATVKTSGGDGTFRIKFVDYGNTALVRKEDIFSMPEEFQCRPRLSVACSLLDGSSYDSDASFSQAVMEKALMVDFVRQRAASWEVRLEVVEDEAAPPQKSSSAESFKVTELVSPAEQEMERAPPVKNYTLRVPLSRFPTCKKKKHPKKKKSQSQPRATFGRLFTARADAFIPPSIQAGDSKKATVLSDQSSGRFQARLKRSSYLLAALERHIAANVASCRTMAADELAEGLKCLVEVQPDRWQRAVVQRVEGDQCRVFLVDHGAERQVPRDAVRQQLSSLETIPELSVSCKRTGDQDVRRLVMGTEVELLFVQHSKDQKLWLVEVSTEGRQVQASQKPAAEEGPAVDAGRPQANQPYWGSAAAVATPSNFRLVLDDVPRVTYPCVLRGVAPVSGDGQWTEEAAAFFQQRLRQRKLRVFFRELVSETRWKVDVLVDGVHMASELVAAGHAGYLDVMLALRFQEQSSDSGDEFGREDEAEGVSDPMKLLHTRDSQCVVM